MTLTLLTQASIEAEGLVQSRAATDFSPTGTLDEVLPVEFVEVSGTVRETLWDQLMNEHHYLGFDVLVGAHLKYLVSSRGRLLAAIGWSSAVWKLKPRDVAIGWTPAQRQRHLPRLANNSRFLILPGIHIPCLASHILSMNIRFLKQDWNNRYGTSLALLETFVDPGKFKGTSYKAANWIHVGTTKGFSKDGRSFRFHGHPKEVFLYPLSSDFREQLGCDKPASDKDPLFPLTHRYLLSLTEFHSRRETMLLQHKGWNTKLPPPFKLNDGDLSLLVDEFRSYHRLFRDCFGRVEHEDLSRCYLQGLMSSLPYKSMEPIALSLMGTSRVKALQRFINAGVWDVEDLARRHREEAAKTLADPVGVISVDGCDFPKKGKESVGVARQYCGRLGKVDNCQAGVFLAYASPQGYALLDRRLFLPESWFSKEQKERRENCRIPDGTTFKTKTQLALEMIQQLHASALFPARWMTGDDSFGRSEDFLDQLPPGLLYLAHVPSDTRVWVKRPETVIPPYSGRGPHPKKACLKKGQPKALTVAAVAKDPSLHWQTVSLAEGAQGPIHAQVARLRVIESRNRLPGQERWLFLRRSLHSGEITYHLSNAPKETPLQEMIRVCTLRWPIEQCFQEGKSEIGMDHYEVRSWPAWHRHMTFVFLAQLFLLRLRHQLKKNSSPHAPSSRSLDERGYPHETVQQKVCVDPAPLLSEKKLCRV